MTSRLSPREILAQLVTFPTVSTGSNLDLIDWVEGYLAAGMDGHVAKPIEVTKLYDAIETAIAAARMARAA